MTKPNATDDIGDCHSESELEEAFASEPQSACLASSMVFSTTLALSAGAEITPGSVTIIVAP